MEVKVQFNLSRMIEKRGINQKELAKIADVRPASLASISKGHVERITVAHIERIANALDVTDIREFMTLEKAE